MFMHVYACIHVSICMLCIDVAIPLPGVAIAVLIYNSLLWSSCTAIMCYVASAYIHIRMCVRLCWWGGARCTAIQCCTPSVFRKYTYMHICIYGYMDMCTHISIHVYMHAHMYASLADEIELHTCYGLQGHIMYIYTYTHIYIHTYMSLHGISCAAMMLHIRIYFMHVCTSIYVCMCMCICMHVCAYMFTHVCTCVCNVYTYVCICTHTHV